MRRPWLLPLVPLWAAGSAWKNRAFDRNPERAERLQLPVISVGSLSAGGAGKTPFIIALGDALRRANVGCDVLSRGYGRRDMSLAIRVKPTGSAEEFGDEPLLIAQRLGRRVYVAATRAEAGRMAEREHRTSREGGQWVHLLDDGFQHRRLLRNVDIVLLTAEDVSDSLLPAGNLRESLCSLRRAHVIVLRREEAALLRPIVEKIFGKRTESTGNVPPVIWEIERKFLIMESTSATRPLAFCGIARPESFRNQLQLSGIHPAALVALRDHQRYDEVQAQQLARQAQSVSADGFITTAKDAVKLTPALRAQLKTVGPLAVADLVVTIDNECNAMAQLLRLIGQPTSMAL